MNSDRLIIMNKNIVLQKFAKRIKDLRKINRISQEKLAEKANLSMHFIGCLERAEKEPTLSTLMKIAEAFDISLSELLKFPDDRKIKSAAPHMLEGVTDLLNLALNVVERYKEKRRS